MSHLYTALICSKTKDEDDRLLNLCGKYGTDHILKARFKEDYKDAENVVILKLLQLSKSIVLYTKYKADIRCDINKR